MRVEDAAKAPMVHPYRAERAGVSERKSVVRRMVIRQEWLSAKHGTPTGNTLRHDSSKMEMVGLARVELATRSLGNCCSIHLSYSPHKLILPQLIAASRGGSACFGGDARLHG